MNNSININKKNISENQSLKDYFANKIQSTISLRNYIRYFKNYSIIIDEDSIIKFIFTSRLDAENIYHFYKDFIEKIFLKTWQNQNIEIQYFYKENDDLINILINEDFQKLKQEIYIDEMREIYNFESFLKNKTNTSASKIVESIACYSSEDILPNASLVFLHSKAGNGKTHLMKAAYNYYKSQNGNVFLTSGIDFLRNYIKDVKSGNFSSIRDEILQHDIILIDNIDDLICKTGTIKFLNNIISEALSKNKYIIITSRNSANDIINLDINMKSIMQYAIDLEILNPDQELIRNFAINFIIKNKLNIPINVIDDNLNFLGKSIRDVKNCLQKLSIEQKIHNTEINASYARSILNKQFTSSNVDLLLHEVDFPDLIQKVSNYFNIKTGALKENIRTSEVCNARKFLIYILHKYKNFSYSSIGKLLNKNHSTIISSIKKINQEFETNPKIRPQISNLIEFILK